MTEVIAIEGEREWRGNPASVWGGGTEEEAFEQNAVRREPHEYLSKEVSWQISKHKGP